MPSKRPSRRAAQRRAAEFRAAAEHVPELPDALEQMLATYAPEAVPPATWSKVADIHAEVMRRSGIAGIDSFRKHLGVVAKYLVHRVERSMSVGIAEAFTAAEIDAYYLHGLEGSAHTRNDYRSRLLNIAKRVNQRSGRPIEVPKLGHRKVRPPYAAADEAKIIRCTLRQRNVVIGQRLAAVVGLCGGAGLDSSDLRHVRAAHVIDHGDGGIEVTVTGTKPRTVWVRRDYETLVRKGVAGLKPNRLVVGVKEDRRNVSTGIIARAELQDAPELDASRLRSTWLTWLLCRPVPVQVILDASGLKTARTLTELVEYLPAISNSEEILRGEVTR